MSGALIERLGLDLGLSVTQLDRIAHRSPYTYKVYPIPKKSGGVRTIAQPAKETKLIQRWLIANVFVELPVHSCATAYSVGASIRLNAIRHTGGSYMSKFDFKDFFPSIHWNDVASHLRVHLGGSLSEADIELATRLSCIRSASMDGLCLSVGAPSSPLLSNSVMFDFDSRVSAWCLERDISYTRYADDLTFSNSRKGLATEIEQMVRRILGEIAYPRLVLNDKKTTHLSKKYQRRVTGVVITNEGALSIGKDRKRLISAMIHRFAAGQLPAPAIFELQGLLGFAIDIEPAFLVGMRAKYGSPIIDAILRIRKPRRGAPESG